MKRSVAIVGLGPRGLYALECLTAALNRTGSREPWALILFDDSGCPGAGPNYAPNQSLLNCLNIPAREIPLARRPASSGVVDLPEFPGYTEWQTDHVLEDDQGYDSYPPRARVGQYLQARFQSWFTAWQAAQDVKLIQSTVVRIEQVEQAGCIALDNGQRYANLDHILLTIGHQPVELDESMIAWQRFADRTPQCRLVAHPYPTDDFIHSDAFTQRRVAVRGMGLSMIDVVKALTEGRGGYFSQDASRVGTYQYHPSGREPARISPFSLDGLPMAPKPANQRIDARYSPADSQLAAFSSRLDALKRGGDGVHLRDGIIESMADLCTGIYQRLGDSRLVDELADNTLSSAIRHWLQDETCSQPGFVSHALETDKSMQQYWLMATDQAPISIDYCVGQVWRHCHEAVYRQLAFAKVGSDLLVPYIQLDQRMKRYAFGPPVDSVARLLALVANGMLTFAVSEDPVIEPQDRQWRLTDNADGRCVDVMINSVQAPPELMKVSSPLVASLRDDQVLVPVEASMGAMTKRDGGVPIRVSGNARSTIALSGRLATGSIVEADALLECFGPALDDWANSIVRAQ